MTPGEEVGWGVGSDSILTEPRLRGDSGVSAGLRTPVPSSPSSVSRCLSVDLIHRDLREAPGGVGLQMCVLCRHLRLQPRRRSPRPIPGAPGGLWASVQPPGPRFSSPPGPQAALPPPPRDSSALAVFRSLPLGGFVCALRELCTRSSSGPDASACQGPTDGGARTQAWGGRVRRGRGCTSRGSMADPSVPGLCPQPSSPCAGGGEAAGL